jgi:hypothetical protein
LGRFILWDRWIPAFAGMTKGSCYKKCTVLSLFLPLINNWFSVTYTTIVPLVPNGMKLLAFWKIVL